MSTSPFVTDFEVQPLLDHGGVELYPFFGRFHHGTARGVLWWLRGRSQGWVRLGGDAWPQTERLMNDLFFHKKLPWHFMGILGYDQFTMAFYGIWMDMDDMGTLIQSLKPHSNSMQKYAIVLIFVDDSQSGFFWIPINCRFFSANPAEEEIPQR